MGLCFNNEIFFQISKGLIHPEFLESLSYEKILVGNLIAPCMDIKVIMEEDPEYKFFLEQILSNLNDTHNKSITSDNLMSDVYKRYDIPIKE